MLECADEDVSVVAELLQGLFDAGVLLQRLDEGANRVLRHHPHLLLQLRELVGRETLVDPGTVVVEVELRLADQERRRAEAVEGG